MRQVNKLCGKRVHISESIRDVNGVIITDFIERQSRRVDYVLVQFKWSPPQRWLPIVSEAGVWDVRSELPSINEICSILNGLSGHKAAGPDGLPSVPLEDTGESFLTAVSDQVCITWIEKHVPAA